MNGKAKLSVLDYLRLLWGGRPVLEEAIEQGKVVSNAAQTSGVKTLAFWATALASVSAVAAQVGGLVPPPYGAIVLATSPLLYAISRGLVKRDDPLGGAKPALARSEVLANILAAAGQVALAAGHATSPETAVILTTVHAAAIAAADALAKSGAQPVPEK